MTDLVKYDAMHSDMCRAIEKVYRVEDIKDIRDKAIALETYAKQARNTDAERQACEVRIRAERKAGQLLKEMEKAKRGPDKNGSGQRSQRTTSDDIPTLAEIGISKNQSHRWQQLAAIPKDEFEAAFDSTKKPTTKGIIDNRKVENKRKPMNPDALWLWGRLRDFERFLNLEPNQLLNEMTEAMRSDVLRIAPSVADWLAEIEE